MTRFLLVRHGRFDGVGAKHAGRAPGTHLNADGREDALRLAAALRDVPITAIVSSPLERTRETAEPVAADHALAIEIEPSLIEVETGAWTGRTFADLSHDPLWRRFNAFRSLTTAPGGELMLAVQHRAVDAFLALRARFENGTVLVVSHGDVIRSFLLYALAMPIDLYHRLEISPGRISIVDADDDSIRVLQVNGDTATLPR
ncbi:MAG TPA: histidine phosphatase family protein [Vicinamibacterales bacterium]|nr:histidine phosphatase family protein [Vicinamibacterales bacterium]